MKTKDLTLLSIFTAIIIVMASVPYLGFIQIGPVAYTIIHIPVLIIAALYGKKHGAIMGAVFGITSLLVALTRGGGVFALIFINPLVSVIPRIVFGYLAGLVLHPFVKNKIALIIGVFILTLVHSFLVLSMISIVGHYNILNFVDLGEFKFGFDIVFGVLLSNSLIEGLIAAIICPLIIIPLERVKR